MSRYDCMPVEVPHVEPSAGRWSAIGSDVWAGEKVIASCTQPGSENLSMGIDRVERLRWENKANAHVMAQAKRALELLEALVIFHSPSPWDAAKAAEWSRLTGSSCVDVTSKTLCDLARAVLLDAGRKVP